MALNVVVCVKQIPDPADPGALDADYTLKRDVKLILDESDSYGVEMALQLVDAAGGGEVTLVSMARQEGTVSSSYELDVAVGPLRMRQQVEVVEAVPPTLLKTVTSMQGRVAAVQTARIEPTDIGCRVT